MKAVREEGRGGDGGGVVQTGVEGLLSVHQRVGTDGVGEAAGALLHLVHQQGQIVQLALSKGTVTQVRMKNRELMRNLLGSIQQLGGYLQVQDQGPLQVQQGSGFRVVNLQLVEALLQGDVAVLLLGLASWDIGQSDGR